MKTKCALARVLLAASVCLSPLTAWAGQKVLVVLSAASEIPLRGGISRETGFYLNELTVPLKRLIDAGYEPVFVTPGGVAPHLDPSSDDPKYFGGDAKSYEAHRALLDQLHLVDPHQTPVRNIDDIASGDLAAYTAVFVPGGHAPMVDLISNRSLGRILKSFHAAGKTIALICHGPIALISALHDPESFVAAMKSGDRARAASLAAGWAFQGYPLTVFSDVEDMAAETFHFHAKMFFFPEDALRTAGGAMREGLPGKSNTVAYREVLTGQNPQSDAELADKLIAILAAGKSAGSSPAGR
jgi:putative intracellular protease/amidase